MRRGNTLKILNEWYTPSILIEAARATMGSIDLDPASTALANRTVQATMYYTKEDNGLLQPWCGNIFLNPPYGVDEQGNSNLRQFFDTLVAEYARGEVRQAVAVLIAKTDTSWFAGLWHYPLCFIKYKLHFDTPTRGRHNLVAITRETRDTHIFGTVILYMGTRLDDFITNFAPHGRIVLPASLAAAYERQQKNAVRPSQHEYGVALRL